MSAASNDAMIRCALACVLVLAAPAAAAAECAGSWSSAHQDGAADIARNARLVVQFEHWGQVDRVWTQPGGGFSFVADSGATIPARVAEEHGQFLLVLEPATPFAPDTHYRLAGQAVDQHHIELGFTTGRRIDLARPVLTRVETGAFERIEYGCGPSELIPITIEASADAAYLRVRVFSSEWNRDHDRYAEDVVIRLEGSVAQFGHDMCSGNYWLREGDLLYGQVSVLDASFNESDSMPILLDAN